MSDKRQQEDPRIEEIMKHLDTESGQGVWRMSVIVDENAKESKSVSHKCCHMYGRPANETVGMLDMYTDLASQSVDLAGQSEDLASQSSVDLAGRSKK